MCPQPWSISTLLVLVGVLLCAVSLAADESDAEAEGDSGPALVHALPVDMQEVMNQDMVQIKQRYGTLTAAEQDFVAELCRAHAMAGTGPGDRAFYGIVPQEEGGAIDVESISAEVTDLGLLPDSFDLREVYFLNDQGKNESTGYAAYLVHFSYRTRYNWVEVVDDERHQRQSRWFDFNTNHHIYPSSTVAFFAQQLEREPSSRLRLNGIIYRIPDADQDAIEAAEDAAAP